METETLERKATVEVHAGNPAQVETPPTWHWCPTCKLASQKTGKCPGCGDHYVVAPELGVPDTPHMPKVRAGRTRRALVAGVAGRVALVGGFVAAIFLLASHGATTIDSSAPAASGSTVDGSSSYSIASLHGTLRLQGSWSPGMAQLQLPTSTTAGAKLTSELSVSRGSESILVGSFASSDPSSALNQFVTTKPQTSNDPMGNDVTVETSRDVSIAGYTTVAQDIEVRNPKGGMVNRGTLYAISAGDKVVIIRTQAGSAQVGDLATIEQALVNIG